MELLLQRCFDGLFNGAIYASLAVALVMIFRATGLLNFAQGEMAMICGYIALVLLSDAGTGLAGTGVAGYLPGHPWPVSIAIAGAVVIGFGLGVAVERFLVRPLGRSSPLAQVNVTIGLLILINGIILQTWGSFGRFFPSPFPAGVDDYTSILGARLRHTTVGVWAVLLVVITGLGVMLARTRVGLAFRAITSNSESAALVGVDVRRTLAIGWGIAAGIGALAASLVGGVIVLEPLTMMKMLIYALAAATIGGLDSPKGAIAGGLIVGLSQSLVPGYLGVPTELSILPPLTVMIVVLLVRPHGLFGTAPVERV